MDDLELAYVHDGSIEGLLTAVFLGFVPLYAQARAANR